MTQAEGQTLQGAGIDLTLNLAATAAAAGACCLPALHFMAYFAAHYAARDKTKRNENCAN